MKTALVLVLAATGLTATPSLAQESRTVTVDAPRYEASRNSTYDRNERSLSSGTELTRKSDGAAASSSFERQRTGNGVSRERTSTDFEGRTASMSYQRARGEDGWEAAAQHARRDGTIVDFQGQATRTETGYVAEQTRAVNGQPAGSRTVARTRQPRRGR